MAKLFRNGENFCFSRLEILNFEFMVLWGKYCPSENKLCSEQIGVDSNNRWEGEKASEISLDRAQALLAVAFSLCAEGFA